VTVHGDRAVAEGALRSTQGVTLVERLDPGVGAADDAPAIAAPTRFRVTFEGPCSATAGAQEALAQATERCVAALVAAGVGVREVRPGERVARGRLRRADEGRGAVASAGRRMRSLWPIYKRELFASSSRRSPWS